jgi:hemoglobin
MRHVRFPIGQPARDRWMELMNAALTEAGFPVEVEMRLRAFFESTATFLINRPDQP